MASNGIIANAAGSSFTIPSRTSSDPARAHKVRVLDGADGKRYVRCNCAAAANGFNRAGVCWASKAVAQFVGIGGSR